MSSETVGWLEDELEELKAFDAEVEALNEDELMEVGTPDEELVEAWLKSEI